MKKALLLLPLLSSLFCGPAAPPIEPGLTHFATPDERLPYFKGKNFDPTWPKSEKELSGLRKLSHLSLTDQNEKPQDLAARQGKITVVSFFFAACHGICPLVTRNLMYIAKKFRQYRNIDILSLSLNPEADTPARLKHFANRYQIKKKNWYFLTGDRKEIYSIARNDFAADLDLPAKKGPDDFLHTENVYLLDKNLYLRGIFKGRGIGQMKRLSEQIDLLLKEG